MERENNRAEKVGQRRSDCRIFYGKRPGGGGKPAVVNNFQFAENSGSYRDNRGRNQPTTGGREFHNHSGNNSAHVPSLSVNRVSTTRYNTANLRCTWNVEAIEDSIDGSLETRPAMAGYRYSKVRESQVAAGAGVMVSRGLQQINVGAAGPADSQCRDVQLSNGNQKQASKVTDSSATVCGNSVTSNVQPELSSREANSSARAASVQIPVKGCHGSAGAPNVWRERQEFRMAQPNSEEEELEMLQRALAQSKLEAEERQRHVAGEEEKNIASLMLSPTEVPELAAETAIKSANSDQLFGIIDSIDPGSTLVASENCKFPAGIAPTEPQRSVVGNKKGEEKEDWDACCMDVPLQTASSSSLSCSVAATESRCPPESPLTATIDPSLPNPFHSVDSPAPPPTCLSLPDITSAAPEGVSDNSPNVDPITDVRGTDTITSICPDGDDGSVSADYDQVPATDATYIYDHSWDSTVPGAAMTGTSPTSCSSALSSACHEREMTSDGRRCSPINSDSNFSFPSSDAYCVSPLRLLHSTGSGSDNVDVSEDSTEDQLVDDSMESGSSCVPMKPFAFHFNPMYMHPPLQPNLCQIPYGFPHLPVLSPLAQGCPQFVHAPAMPFQSLCPPPQQPPPGYPPFPGGIPMMMMMPSPHNLFPVPGYAPPLLPYLGMNPHGSCWRAPPAPVPETCHGCQCSAVPPGCPSGH